MKLSKIMVVLLMMLLILTLPSCANSKYKLSKSQRNIETQRVFKFIKDNYKNKILAGQQLSCDGEELKYIYEVTGKQPAIAGFDMINQTEGWIDSAVDDAIAWHQETGGIVSFMWH